MGRNLVKWLKAVLGPPFVFGLRPEHQIDVVNEQLHYVLLNLARVGTEKKPTELILNLRPVDRSAICMNGGNGYQIRGVPFQVEALLDKLQRSVVAKVAKHLQKIYGVKLACSRRKAA
ncbi:hypothetical protein TYRP_004370 [Tyrophagus putrescentiae]|nr:hypothetical protein TYRP_004370 [Tyrophagus putrescentiae]